MPLPIPDLQRQLMHTRTISIAAYLRADQCWDLEAHITDIKTHDAKMAFGVRPAGIPIHDLWLRLTIDSQFLIVAAHAAAEQIPFPGFCADIHPAYSEKLVGKSLQQGFRRTLQESLGGVLGCTHLTELAQVLPTAAMQAMAGVPTAKDEARVEPEKEHKQPFHIDNCHAMRADGAAVAKFYPRWASKTTSPLVE